MGAAAMIGMQMASSYMGNKQAKKANKNQKKLAARRSQYYQQFTNPEYHAKLLDAYRNQFQQGYMPALRQMGDTLGLNEQGAQQAFATDTARRGLSGSGMAFAGQNAIRAARTTGLGEAQRAYQMDVENAARQQAGNTIGEQLRGAEVENPYQYYDTPPSMLQSLLQGGQAGIGDSGQYGQLTGASGNFGSLIGLKGGPSPYNQYGPQQPYYIGQQPGRG